MVREMQIATVSEERDRAGGAREMQIAVPEERWSSERECAEENEKNAKVRKVKNKKVRKVKNGA